MTRLYIVVAGDGYGVGGEGRTGFKLLRWLTWLLKNASATGGSCCRYSNAAFDGARRGNREQRCSWKDAVPGAAQAGWAYQWRRSTRRTPPSGGGGGSAY